MSGNSRDGSVTLKVICAILFVTFVISYVYWYQCDVLAMMQYAWSGGLKHYDRNVGAIVLTTTSVAVAAITMVFSRMPSRYYTLNFYPSLLLLGALTAVSLENGAVCVAWGSFILLILLFIGSCFLIRVVSDFKAYSQPLRSTGAFSHLWWKNFFFLFIAMLVVNYFSNTERTLHTRLAVERMCMNGQYEDALEKGFAKYDNDSSLTMLRAVALANIQSADSVSLLGERLFQYEITGSSRSLFPQQDKSSCFLIGNAYNLWQTIGFVPYNQNESPTTILERQIAREKVRQVMYNDTLLDKESRDSISKPLCKPVARDYLLCAYLLDRNLSGFVKLLKSTYALNDKLPQHYREACVLYGKLTGSVVLADAALEADYADFLAIMRANRDQTLRYAALRDAYFGTYWYYYYNPKKQ